MRNYSCHVFFRNWGRLAEANHHACWSMLKECAKKAVYIANFDDPSTARHQSTLIGLINEITPCEIVVINPKPDNRGPFMKWLAGKIRKENDEGYKNTSGRYIKFKMLNTYGKSLVLLSFIRNLWYEPVAGYTKAFFSLLETAKYADPLKQLTWANKEAVKNIPSVLYGLGHSNVHPYKSLKIKSSKSLLVYKGNDSGEFLTK